MKPQISSHRHNSVDMNLSLADWFSKQSDTLLGSRPAKANSSFVPMSSSSSTLSRGSLQFQHDWEMGE